MAEVYVRSNDTVKTRIFWLDNIVDADGPVVCDIYDITEDPIVSPSINPEVPILSSVATTKSETDIGTYFLTIPRNISSRPKSLKIGWRYTVSGTLHTHFSYCDIVQPYCSLSEAIEDLAIGTDPSDPNYKPYHELRMAEKYARKQIEDYTGQKFYLYLEENVVYGSGSDILPLPSKIQSLYKLYENDLLLVDNTVDPSVNNWLYDPIVSETGFGLRIDRSSMLDNTVYVANGMVPPPYLDNVNGAFKKDYRYRVDGFFGWDRVPDNVEQATIQLMGHYFGKDRMWADRYLKNVSTFDWDFEYSDEAFKGTGCAYADKLLADYVIDTVLII